MYYKKKKCGNSVEIKKSEHLTKELSFYDLVSNNFIIQYSIMVYTLLKPS